MPGSRAPGLKSSRLRHAFDEANEGSPDLQEDGQPASRPTAPGHTKLESTVRYLGIEVDDALSTSEQVEL